MTCPVDAIICLLGSRSSNAQTLNLLFSYDIVNPCKDGKHAILNDAKRNKNNGVKGYLCDKKDHTNGVPDWKGGNIWYRFAGAAGSQLADSVVPPYHCGGYYPGYLQEAHPVLAFGETVIRKVCWNWKYYHVNYKNTNCGKTTDVVIKRCQGFYIYKLQDVPVCHSKYCGQ